MTLGRMYLTHLEQVFDQAATKLGGWQNGLLNMGGRRELVEIVLSSLPTYLLTAIKPPMGFYKEINKICQRFLWAGQQQLHGG
jgi:hypothetical protein